MNFFKSKKHFKFNGKTKQLLTCTLHQIVATQDLPQHGVHKGDIGGWIEKEDNLSDGAWVSDNARVFGNAQVCGNAWVSGNAQVYGNAQVSGNAWVFGNARVYGNAQVSGDAWVFGNAQVSGNARVYGNAQVSGDAWVFGNAVIDSVSAIMWFTIVSFYTITVTRKYIFIGCNLLKRAEIKKISQKEAEKRGCPKNLYKPLKAMILEAMKIVKDE